jgi:hypothetical protein
MDPSHPVVGWLFPSEYQEDEDYLPLEDDTDDFNPYFNTEDI